MTIVPKTFYDDKSYFLYIDPSSHVISQSKILEEKSAEKTIEKVQFVLATDYQPWFWSRWSTGINEVGYCVPLTRIEAIQVCHYIESTFTPETAQALGIDPSIQRVPRPITLQERIFCRKTAYIVGGIAIVVIVGIGFYKFGGTAIISRIFTRFSALPEKKTPSAVVTEATTSHRVPSTMILGDAKIVKCGGMDHTMMHGVPDMMQNLPDPLRYAEETQKFGSGPWIDQKLGQGISAMAETARKDAHALSQMPTFQSDWFKLQQNQGMRFPDSGMH